MRHAAYPEYKESGVQWLGNVPEHWEVKRGRFVTRVNPPSPVLRSLNDDCEISFVPMDAVNEYGGLRLDQIKIKAEVGGGYTEFQSGDVVIAKITPCFENGKGSLATALVNGAALGTTELHVLRSEKLDNRYLFFLTITDGYRKLGESEMYGAGGQKRVPPEFCKDFQTPLPPLPEQTAIADFLDRETGRIDVLVARKRRLIELLREKRAALISRTVRRGLPADAAREFGLEPHTRFKDSGIDWLGEVPEGWEVKSLRYLFHIRAGGDLKEDFYSEERTQQCPYPIYTNSIQSDIPYGFTSKPYFGANTITVTGRGEIGHAVYRDHEYDAIIRLLVLTPKGIGGSCKYFAYFINSMLKFFGGSTAVSQLSAEQIRPYRVFVPPLPEQTAIATYLDRETSKIDRLAEKVEGAVGRLQEYRTALITAAVTGKIDVREAVTSHAEAV
jgi:type I restriction enzyme S subunit